MRCYLKIGSPVRVLINVLLPLSLCELGITPAWSVPMIFLKDGTKIEAAAKPVCMEGQYRFTDLQGQFHAIPVTQIDVPATEEAIKGTSNSNSKKVSRKLTNEDIAGTPLDSHSLQNNGQVSSSSLRVTSAPTKKDLVIPQASDPRAEVYWRRRAGEIRTKIEQIDKAMADLSEKMKSGKSDGIKIGFNTYTPVILADFGDQMKPLQQEKDKLLLQKSALEEEARKAGAQPGWLR
jgi:hypothetical protein